jgi:long-chain acyl-CoA synthetase
MVDHPWYAHYDPGVTPHLSYPDITLSDLFTQTAERHPDRAATVFHGRKLTYRQLRLKIEAFAAGLHALGIRPGERIAIMLPNVPQFVIAFYGALRAGAVVVPTNPLYMHHELEHQLADSGASAVVTLDQLFGKVQAVLPSTQIRTVIVTGVEEALPRHLQPLFTLKQRRQGQRRVRRGGIVHRFADLLAKHSRDDVRSGQERLNEDVAVLQYTGGTTGLSKGAMLTHRNLVANAMQAHAWQGTFAPEHMSVLCAAPFFHVYGLTIGMNFSIVSAATMLLIPRWIPKQVAAVAKKHRPQVFPGVPTMYVALAEVPDSEKKLGSLEVCMSGAAPLLPAVQEAFEAVSGARVVEGYGLTEASPVTHCNPLHAGRRPGTVGVPFPDTEAMITDPESWEPLPPGTVGEMTVSGPQVMKGYWNRPEETLAVLRDGWLHTGDMAMMDEDGYFRMVERKKDIILAGGYNVYPREVEEVLHLHPKITEAAVIGVPSAYRGETVKAFVVLADGATTTPDEIIAFCKEELAVYKVPKIVEFRDELPKTLIGKVLRRELRERAVSSEPLAVSNEERPVA